MIGDLELMRLHVEALFTHDAAGDLLRVNEPGGDAAPRFFLGVTPQGAIRRFRHDVDPETRRTLELLSEEIDASFNATSLPEHEAVLARFEPVKKTWSGPAFVCPQNMRETSRAIPVTARNSEVLGPFLTEWIPDVERCQPMVAVVVDNSAVAVCGSVRRTPAADEAGLETAAPFRRRGYGAAAVQAWAAAVYLAKKVPLYSTSWHNDASRSVARKVGLACFGSDLHIT